MGPTCQRLIFFSPTTTFLCFSLVRSSQRFGTQSRAPNPDYANEATEPVWFTLKSRLPSRVLVLLLKWIRAAELRASELWRQRPSAGGGAPCGPMEVEQRSGGGVELRHPIKVSNRRWESFSLRRVHRPPCSRSGRSSQSRGALGFPVRLRAHLVGRRSEALGMRRRRRAVAPWPAPGEHDAWPGNIHSREVETVQQKSRRPLATRGTVGDGAGEDVDTSYHFFLG